MARILSGAPVAGAILEKISEDIDILKQNDIIPTLTIIRVGEKGDDISYERSAAKKCEKSGVAVRNLVFPPDVTHDRLIEAIDELNNDTSVHGVLILRPLPKCLDEVTICQSLVSSKDIDCVTFGSLSGVLASLDVGFAPCTAQACMEILDYYGIEIAGERVVVVGRSRVIGLPVAAMLTKRNGTVTICHTKTADLPTECRRSGILIAAAGKARMIDEKNVSSDQVIIDVGINITDDGGLVGDVNFDKVNALVKAITPVPGGVGTVTSAVLIKHVVQAARAQAGL